MLNPEMIVCALTGRGSDGEIELMIQNLAD